MQPRPQTSPFDLEQLARRIAFADLFSREATVAPFFRDLVRARNLRITQQAQLAAHAA